MDDAAKAAFANLDAGLKQLSNSVQTQTELIQALSGRLDQLIAVLAPKDPGKNYLGELLDQLVTLGHAQIRIAEETRDEILKMSAKSSHLSELPGAGTSNGGLAA